MCDNIERDYCHLLVSILNLKKKKLYSTSWLRTEDSEIKTNTLCEHRFLNRTRQKNTEKTITTKTTSDGRPHTVSAWLDTRSARMHYNGQLCLHASYLEVAESKIFFFLHLLTTLCYLRTSNCSNNSMTTKWMIN